MIEKDLLLIFFELQECQKNVLGLIINCILGPNFSGHAL